MQDEIRDKTVALVVNVGKANGRLTAELLKAAMREYLKHAAEPPHGKQSVKSLVKQGAGVQSIEITDRNIKSFERVARKYGIDFALKKDKANGKYIVFFKARDADALNEAFKEYTAVALRRRNHAAKPSLLKQLAKFKQVVQQKANDLVKNRKKGAMEH